MLFVFGVVSFFAAISIVAYSIITSNWIYLLFGAAFLIFSFNFCLKNNVTSGEVNVKKNKIYYFALSGGLVALILSVINLIKPIEWMPYLQLVFIIESVVSNIILLVSINENEKNR